MSALKEDLFERAIRNQLIQGNPEYIQEYKYNQHCISLIQQMVGPELLALWRAEFKRKYANETDYLKSHDRRKLYG